ncbi:hypothetical protein DES34_102228 [Brevibacillus brevis]|nr:hypothetical protein DES34_102228 [Brevibacillus brevis]VEF92368.1 Uncharacterised protein [Brevibacillus brevis]
MSSLPRSKQKAPVEEAHFQSKRLWSPTQRRKKWRGISASPMESFLETSTFEALPPFFPKRTVFTLSRAEAEA